VSKWKRAGLCLKLKVPERSCARYVSRSACENAATGFQHNCPLPDLDNARHNLDNYGDWASYNIVPSRHNTLHPLYHFLTGPGRLRLFSVLALLSAAPAIASTNSAWYARVWQSEDGLPNDSVTALTQTPDGYLWLATPSRVARFDGKDFDDYPQTLFGGRNNQRITVIVSGRDGSLWLPMDRGPIVHLKNGAVEIVTNNVPNLVVEDAVVDGNDSLWVGYRGGTLRRVKDGVVVKFDEYYSGFPGARGGDSLAIDNAGRFWFAQRGHVYQYRDGRFNPVAAVPNTITRLATAAGGGLWICSGGDFFKYDETNGLKLLDRLPADAAGISPTTMLETRDGSVWVGT